jgi:hypothetical protein
LNPHQWKHSYATIGAQHLAEWYNGRASDLQKCCMHEKYDTTLGYIQMSGDDFLGQFG